MSELNIGAVILGVIFGKFLWELIKWVVHRRRYPYRWSCPQCGFSFETNIRETYEISKSSHNHSRLKQFVDTDPWNLPETKEACLRFHPGEECKPGDNHPAAGRG